MVAMVKPYRHPKTGIFWIRKVIPERLRPQFGGRREFKVTLRTREPQEAKLLASARLIEFEHRLQGGMGIACKELVVPPHGLLRIADNPLLIAMSVQQDTLLDLFEPWQREAQPKTKTADEYKKTIHEFHECVGLFPLTSIRTEQVRRYKDTLVSKGSLAAGSINKRVGVIKTLLNFAKANG